jgi:sodium transport system permease protein
MKLANVSIVYRKELRDTLRDRRSLFTSIVLPVLAFPVLMGGMIGLMIFFAQRASRDVTPVMLLGPENAPALAAKLRAQENFQMVPSADDYAARINDKKLRAAVEFPENLEANLTTRPEETQTVTVYHFEGEFRSREALRTIQRAVRDYRDQVVEQRLAARGLSADALKPFAWERANVASAEQVTGVIAGMILPYMVIILAFTGALYPAIDLSAGEKERGTLETILASPVRRSELVAGKFLLVLSASVLTTVLALGSLGGTLLAGAQYLGRLTGGFVVALSWKAALTVFFLTLPLAVVFSAGLLAVAVLARNYREAQSYTTPLTFLVLLPAVGSLVPGVELNSRLALVPILNVSLAAKDIFIDRYPWALLGLIFLSTCLYAAVALWVAGRQFQREEVLFRH